MFKSFYLKTQRIVNTIRWSIHYFWFKIVFQGKKPNQMLIIDGKETNIILVPHADDELIGTFGLIYANAPKKVLYFGFTGSNPSKENKIKRDSEFAAFCSGNGIDFEIVSDDYDFGKILTGNNRINLFFPSIIDWHDEHRYLNTIVKSIIRGNQDNVSLYWYSITVPIVSNSTCYLFEGKRLLDLKYNEFRKYYASQKHLPITRFKIQERINGLMIDKYAAENYLHISLPFLYHAIDFSNEEEQRINRLKFSINSIRSVRKESRKLYHDLFESYNDSSV